jgi:hypothetical protein
LSKIISVVTVTVTFDPKIIRVLPLPQGNHVVKFGILTLLSKILFIVMITFTKLGHMIPLFILGSLGQRSRVKVIITINRIFDNRVVSLPQGNHVAKLGRDPIYRTKVIVRKRPCCQKLSCGRVTIIPFDNLYRRAYFVMHTFLV